jgi:hypothetical protein
MDGLVLERGRISKTKRQKEIIDRRLNKKANWTAVHKHKQYFLSTRNESGNFTYSQADKK